MFHEREPFETAGDDPAVQAVARAHRFVHGDQAILAGKRIVGDANLFVNLGGVPSFYYGPSNETAHSDGEWGIADAAGTGSAGLLRSPRPHTAD